MPQAVCFPTSPASAEHRPPSHRIPDWSAATSSAGMRSSWSSSSVEKRGQSAEYEQQAPQLWQSNKATPSLAGQPGSTAAPDGQGKRL
jgi:hypothetical protein